jgi:hypothetical protein
MSNLLRDDSPTDAPPRICAGAMLAIGRDVASDSDALQARALEAFEYSVSDVRI